MKIKFLFNIVLLCSYGPVFSDSNPLHLEEVMAVCQECHQTGKTQTPYLLDKMSASEALEKLREDFRDPEIEKVNDQAIFTMASTPNHAALSEDAQKNLFDYLTGKTTESYEKSQQALVDHVAFRKMPSIPNVDTEGWRKAIPKTNHPVVNAFIENAAIYTNEGHLNYRGNIEKMYQDSGRGSTFDKRSGLQKYNPENLPLAATLFGSLFSRTRLKGPLGAALGLDQVSKQDFYAIKLFYFPVQHRNTDKRKPLSWWREYFPDQRHFLAWEFPKGSIFGEVVFHKINGRPKLPFEIRMRWITGDGSIQPDIFRPFPSALEMADAIASRWDDPESLQAIEQLKDPTTLVKKTMKDPYNYRGQGQGHILNVTGGVDLLPALGASKVATLIRSTVFKSTLNRYWKWDKERNLKSFAPTSDKKGHLVPRGYEAHAIAVNQDSCTTCHNVGAVTLHEMDPSARNGNSLIHSYGDLYGNNPASYLNGQGKKILDRSGYPIRDMKYNNILSFHPFSRQAYDKAGKDEESRYRDGYSQRVPAFHSYFQRWMKHDPEQERLSQMTIRESYVTTLDEKHLVDLGEVGVKWSPYFKKYFAQDEVGVWTAVRELQNGEIIFESKKRIPASTAENLLKCYTRENQRKSISPQRRQFLRNILSKGLEAFGLHPGK